jgi:hypothetical protein
MTLLTLPRASIPVIDSKGYMSREWYRWATDATARMGGVEGASTDDLTLSQFEDAGIEEHKLGLFRLTDDIGQLPLTPQTAEQDDVSPPVVQAMPVDDVGNGIDGLRAQIAELTKAVEALQQGMIP